MDTEAARAHGYVMGDQGVKISEYKLADCGADPSLDNCPWSAGPKGVRYRSVYRKLDLAAYYKDDAAVSCEERPFVLKLEKDRLSEGEEFTAYHGPGDHAAGKVDFIKGGSYRVARLKFNTKATTVSSGSLADITFRLQNSTGGPVEDGWFVNSDNGDIFGKFGPTAGGRNISMRLVALDASGKQQVVETYMFQVKDPVFVIKTTDKRKIDDDFTDYDDKSVEYFQNTPYTIGKKELSKDTVVRDGTISDITYTLEVTCSASFADPATPGAQFLPARCV